MKIITDKLQNLWSSDETRVLVLTSLGIQILLIFLAPLRKRNTNIMLALTLWLLYLTADNVATLGLGNISHQTPAQSGELTILWAPFLLVHLGGPDTITSYSIEDNELWWRHLLGLIFQVLITVYIFFQSPPTGWLWIPTIFVFIPGLIKFAERTHALRLASKDNLKDKIISELRLGNRPTRGSTENTATNAVRMENTTSNAVQANGTTEDSTENTTSNAVQANGNTKGIWGKIKAVLFPPKDTIGSTENTTSNAIRMENTTSNTDQANGTTKGTWDKIMAILFPPEDTIDNIVLYDESIISEDGSKAILEGFCWLKIFKRLLVDVTFEAELLMKSQDRFSDLNSTNALKLVAIELSFLYDVLHTKAVHMHSISGRVLRYFSLVSIIAALVVFHLLDKQKYVPRDIIITYVLFGAGLSLEVIATMLLVFSDWTVAALTRTKPSQCVASCIVELVKGFFLKGFFLKDGKPRWARTIGQFNLVGVCLRDRDTVKAKIMRFLKVKHWWDNIREKSLKPLKPGLLEEIMFTEAKRRAQNVHIYNVLVEARAYRGNKALERHGQLEKLNWSMKREFDECIILWHLATDICYYNDTPNQPNRNDSDNKLETSNQPKGNNDTEGETSNQPKGNNDTEGETSNQPKGNNDTERETSNQPKGNNDTEGETSNQPKGNNDTEGETSNQPKGKNETERETSNQPKGNNDTEGETSNQPKGNNDTEGETSNQPKGNNDTERETSNQPKGNNDTEGETSNQPKGNNDTECETSNQPKGNNDTEGETSNQPKGNNDTERETSNQPNGNNDTEGETSNQPKGNNDTEGETSNQPKGNNDTERETSNQPKGNNDTERETSNQPKGNNDTEHETSNQPKGNNDTEGETSNQPKGNNDTERETSSNQPKGNNETEHETSNQPNGENQEPSNQPNGRTNCWSLPKRKVQPNEKIDERDVSWKTSNYMVYLLTQQQSMMQLGYGKTRFEATCAVVKNKLKGKVKLEHKNARDKYARDKHAREELKKDDGAAKNEGKNEGAAKNEGATNKMGISVLKKIWANLRSWGRRKREEDKRKREDEEEMGELVLKAGLKLATELLEVDQEIRWKLISETWMEMLGYAAIHCNSYQHARSLSRGGELLTHLWLLMAQLGVVDEHKVQQYQPGTV